MMAVLIRNSGLLLVNDTKRVIKSQNTDSVDGIVPMVAVIIMYEMVVQNIAISVPLGMATVGFWKVNDIFSMCRNITVCVR